MDRTHVVEPRGELLIRRYKDNYSLPEEANITEEMVLKHWRLEKQLTAELLQSTQQNRWEVFSSCYTALYSELNWLNECSDQHSSSSDDEKHALWIDAIGGPPKLIYEVGSGQGKLLTYLAQKGFTCKGTEITPERGGKISNGAEMPNPQYGISDGINLARFEPKNTYDVVISDQVIEHFHPDDLLLHFKGVHAILAENGRYVFRTPHRFTGPHDVSRVFCKKEPKGMHLKEYTYIELVQTARAAGFELIYYPFIPNRVRRLMQPLEKKNPAEGSRFGQSYLTGLMLLERVLLLLPLSARRVVARVLNGVRLLPNNINLAAKKNQKY